MSTIRTALRSDTGLDREALIDLLLSCTGHSRRYLESRRTEELEDRALRVGAVRAERGRGADR